MPKAKELVADAESIVLWVAQTNLVHGTGLRKYHTKKHSKFK